MSLLEMKNIKKSFNGVEVLKDISLKVEKGEKPVDTMRLALTMMAGEAPPAK